PRTHLVEPERHGFHRLHGLFSVNVGQQESVPRLSDFEKIAAPLAAGVLQSPMRDLGGKLLDWEELVGISGWARERGVPFHMDGARLWESQPFYGRLYHEIADLFDTVYVSFYKILGGIAGSVLAGPTDIIAEARVW